MTDMTDRARELGAEDCLTSKQIDAITYAYLDVCATNKILNEDMWEPQHALAEIGEAVVQTKVDLEKAFPFLIKGVEDE